MPATAKKKPEHTPMMAQYLDVKANYPDCLLFYRMGDFYELFMDDAVIAADVLDITLTKRGKKQGDDIPMCGVPWHSHESYLARLIKAGYKVAICEQVETPEEAKKRGGYKALVKRDVVRVVTQGTLNEDSLLEARKSNYLACLALNRGHFAFSALEFSTGSFSVQSIAKEQIAAILASFNPSEIILSQSLYDGHQDAFTPYGQRLTIEPDIRFNQATTEKHLLEIYNVKTLDSFGSFNAHEIIAAGGLIDYVKRTQIGAVPFISPLKQNNAQSFMEIDAATRRSLELHETQTGQRKGSLLHAIDRTVSGSGARLLSHWLSHPLQDSKAIQSRQEIVDYYRNNQNFRDKIRTVLRETPDLERTLTRLTVGRGGPRDVLNIKIALRRSLTLSNSLRDQNEPLLKSFVDALSHDAQLSQLLDQLERAIMNDPPALARDGGFIARDYDKQLDHYRSLREDSRKLIASLQGHYANDTGIEKLKISHNNVLGYFIEVNPKYGNTLLVGANDDEKQDNPFVHRQTLANAMRFTTPELSELERDISVAAEKALAIELEIFNRLITEITNNALALKHIAEIIAELDVYTGLAELASDQNYTRPEITEGTSFKIEKGRHPVVEQALKKQENKPFIANNADLSDAAIWLLTGPNMAGKSTYLRQNALIAILAHIGCFVPAENAQIGIIDKIFSRVGASDDLASGRSTFMVEMVETAAILNQATNKSFVILDEIGRGTATFDGLSIAWACIEHLHEANACRTVFATHYHELTTLQEKLPRLSCHAMQVKEWKDKIIFMHEVGSGAANRSYGVHVGKLAGLPGAVTKRAEEILKRLEKSEQVQTLEDLPLFDVQEDQDTYQSTDNHAAVEALEALNPDDLSPREALEALYKLKEKLV